MASPNIPPLPLVVGLAGLLPAAASLAAVVSGDPQLTFTAQALAFAYAALIASFLGGTWWGLAAAGQQRPPAWLWFAAVAPCLIALALCIPWAIGTRWPGPSLVYLGLLIVATLAVDRRLVRLGIAPPWWMLLRVPLSLGLGAMTLIIGVLA